MPDEKSNLNTPPRPGGGGRRRGRRGGRGRGRGPRPPAEQSSQENSPAAEADAPVDETAAAPADAGDHHEPEADTSGGFREPHAEVPEEFASHPTTSEDAPVSEPAAEVAPEPPPAREPHRDERRDHRRDNRRDERRDERPSPPPPRVAPAQRQWVKPADFRPAEDTAIHEAVAHATFIANALKELHEQMDEILELVEVAERQKLADERELDELRRALRRIQPNNRPSHQQQPQQRFQPRRDEPRRPQSEPPREAAPQPEASAPAAAPEPPPAAE